MKCRVLFGLAMVFCGGLLAQATLASPPAWLDDPQSLYPATMYLSALGEGDTRKDAETEATANLSRIFESKVSVDENVQARVYELEQGGSTTSSTETELQRSIGVQSNQTLVNVQMGESYLDSRGRYHVIAFIERLKTGEIYAGKVEENSKMVVFWLDKGKKATDPIAVYAYRNAAAMMTRVNDVLISQLAVISPESREFVELPYDPVKVRSDAADAARALTVSVTLTGDDDGKLAEIVRGALAEQGFAVSEKNVLAISGEVGFENVDIKNPQGTKFLRWTLSMDMKNISNVTLFSIYEKGREGHVNIDEAKARCYRTMESKIKSEFIRKLNGYFDSFVK
jgi:hypothetical protein